MLDILIVGAVGAAMEKIRSAITKLYQQTIMEAVVSRLDGGGTINVDVDLSIATTSNMRDAFMALKKKPRMIVVCDAIDCDDKDWWKLFGQKKFDWRLSVQFFIEFVRRKMGEWGRTVPFLVFLSKDIRPLVPADKIEDAIGLFGGIGVLEGGFNTVAKKILEARETMLDVTGKTSAERREVTGGPNGKDAFNW